MLVAVDGIFKCQIQNKHLCFLIINGFLLNIPDICIWSIHLKCVDSAFLNLHFHLVYDRVKHPLVSKTE